MDLNESTADADQTVADRTRSTNYEGGESYEPDTPQLALTKLTINNLLEETFYRSDEDALQEVIDAFGPAVDADTEFPLKLAYYAREEMYLRDISQVLLVLAARHDEAKQYVREYAPYIMQRADEPATVIATWDRLYGPITFEGRAREYVCEPHARSSAPTLINTLIQIDDPEAAVGDSPAIALQAAARADGVYDAVAARGSGLPSALKKGIADALHQFDAYQFGKYSGDRRAVSMYDVVNLTHPRPRDAERDEIFERVMYGDLDDHPDVEPLPTPETWEAVISERGNTRAAWEDVLPRMGLFARVRNVRNMLDAGVDPGSIFDEGDLETVRESKLYPFRFYQAHTALKTSRHRAPEIEAWLSAAVNTAASVLPDNLGETFVAVDLSGSMRHPLSENSALTYKEIAAFFGAVLSQKGAAVSVFAERFETVSVNPETSALNRVGQILGTSVGGTTNGWKAIDYLTENGLSPERVIMLTDEQIWDSETHARNRLSFGRPSQEERRSVKKSFDRYRSRVSPETALYMIDLSSYGDLTMPEGYRNVYNISGWSEKVLSFVEVAEEPGAMVAEIEGVTLPSE